MLNPNIPEYYCDAPDRYILNDMFYTIVYQENSKLNTINEYRLQSFFTNEIKLRLRSLQFPFNSIESMKILDFCCGSGFLSYHLKKLFPKIKIDLIDISPNEICHAQNLLHDYENINFFCGNALDFDYPTQYDLIVGNSFLHHFPNVPQALKKIYSKLSNHGLFISLHEPTIAALGWESGSCHLPLKLLFQKEIFFKHTATLTQREAYTDIWIFTEKDLYSLLHKQGYINIKTSNSWALRPYLTALYSLHLSEEKNNLSGIESLLLNGSIILDHYLSYIIPSRFFGSCAFLAQKG